MATSSVVIDIRANTQKALNEFKTFSSQLENKFLISGLKLDVVRNALSQINREFQKSLGEQGLVSAQSMKAAENQAAILTNIYTGFSKTASSRIVEDFSGALNKVAVQIGSTAKDIQGALSISPFLDRGLSTASRERILTDIQKLSTYSRRAGLGDNVTELLNQFATGQVGGNELQEQDSPLAKLIGARLTQAGAYTAESSRAMSIQDRTRIIQQILSDIDLEQLAKETSGFRAVLEQFSASLFNSREGLFGAMKEFVLKTGESPTNLFKETTKLFEAIFGPQGFIKTLGRELARAFGVGDDDTAFIKFLGRGIRFITRLINNLRDLVDDVLNNPLVKGAVEIVKSAFSGVVSFLGKLDEIAKNPPTAPNITKETIQEFIKKIGSNIRGVLTKIGAIIRGEDISEEAGTGASIVGTIVDEAGKTILTFFREVGDALLAKAGTIALELGKTLIPTMIGLFGKALGGEGGLIGQLIAAVVGGKLIAGGFGALRGAGTAIGAGRRGFNEFRQGPLGYINRAFGNPFYDEREGGDGGGGRGPRRPRGGPRGPRPGIPTPNIRPQVDNDLSSMFENIRDFNERERFNREFGNAQRQYRARNTPYMSTPEGVASIGDFGDYLPYAGDKYVRRSRANARKERIRGLAGFRITGAALDRYKYSMRDSTPNPRDIDEQILKNSQEFYLRPIGPLPDKSPEPWPWDPVEQKHQAHLESGLSNSARERRVAQRYRRRFGIKGRFGTGMRGLGRRIGIGGALGSLGTAATIGTIFSGRAQAQEGMSSEERAQMEEDQRQQAGGELFGLAGGALGAAAGTAIAGPVGTIIGGVLGDMAGRALASTPFMQPITRALGKFAEDTVKLVQTAWNNIPKAFNSVVKFFTVDLFKLMTDGLRLLYVEIPKGLLNFGKKLAESMISSVVKFDLGQTLKDTWSSLVEAAKNFGQNPGGNYKGSGYYGPTMAKESIMSGRGAMVVNEGEFVIPRDGFGIVADLVRSSADTKSNSRPTKVEASFNISFNVNGGLGVNDIEALRAPVLAIIEDAWDRVSSTSLSRGSTII